MKISSNYEIVQSNNIIYLVNISIGDIFEINDVTKDILDFAEKTSSINALVNIIYKKYKTEDGVYTKADLTSFIKDLVENGILED